MINVLINLIVGIRSQCIWLSNHHTVQFKYITILFFNYTSIKLKKKFQEAQQDILSTVLLKTKQNTATTKFGSSPTSENNIFGNTSSSIHT